MARAAARGTLLAVSAAGCAAHCMPESSCWPSRAEWDGLRAQLTGGLHELSWTQSINSTYEVCDQANQQDFNGEPLSKQAEQTGLCLYNLNCYFANCSWELGPPWTPEKLVPNIPSYAAAVADAGDVAAALAFASARDIAVTVRVHGHSYTGSSTGHGSLLIWMANFTRYGPAVEESFVDTCGTNHGAAVKAGGGETWQQVYTALARDGRYEIGGGYFSSVSASGGWLQGGGLSSPFHRMNGMGIDNVLQFEVVLADGTTAKADACSHADLFWALRGGGGGTFAVVTAAHHRLRPAGPFVYVFMQLGAGYSAGLQSAWGTFWAQESPHMDRRWCGSFSGNSLGLYFHGSEEDARKWIDKLDGWKSSLPLADRMKVTITVVASGDPKYAQYNLTNYNAFIVNTTGWQPPSYWSGAKAANHSNWLVPHDWVVANPGLAAELITDAIDSDTYWMGGAIMDVAANATAVNPATRRAVWSIITADRAYARRLRQLLPASGSEYNHGSPREPDYRRAFWGTNYDRLARIKAAYDPKGLFKCQNCVEPPSSV